MRGHNAPKAPPDTCSNLLLLRPGLPGWVVEWKSVPGGWVRLIRCGDLKSYREAARWLSDPEGAYAEMRNQ